MEQIVNHVRLRSLVQGSAWLLACVDELLFSAHTLTFFVCQQALGTGSTALSHGTGACSLFLVAPFKLSLLAAPYALSTGVRA